MSVIDTLKLSEFEKLLKSKEWKHSSYVKTLDIYEDEIDDEYGEKKPVTRVYGLLEVESKHGNITITYSEGYEYMAGDKESFKTSIEGMDAPWVVDGVTLVDDDGEPMYFDHEAMPSEFSRIDYELVKSGM